MLNYKYRSILILNFVFFLGFYVYMGDYNLIFGCLELNV